MSAADIQPRRPLIAALLSLALPGLGQLYNGEVNKGLWLFLAFVLTGSPAATVAALYVPSGLMLPLLVLMMLATLTLWIGGIAQACRRARGLQVYTRREWQVSGFYALLLLAGLVLIVTLSRNMMRDHMVQSFSIPSRSMEPGILPGDILFADKRYNCPNCKIRVATGDIGIFVYPNDRTQNYIKRVIGLPGDHVSLHGHDLQVNGKSLIVGERLSGDKAIVTEQSGTHQWEVQWNARAESPDMEVTVPQGQIFLLGDNRDQSSDSRQFGPVPLSDLVGKARQIWFSRGLDGVRWGRLGMVVQ